MDESELHGPVPTLASSPELENDGDYPDESADADISSPPEPLRSDARTEVGSVQVAVRVRPPNPAELAAEASGDGESISCVRFCEDDPTRISVRSLRRGGEEAVADFAFDNVFRPDAAQEQVHGFHFTCKYILSSFQERVSSLISRGCSVLPMPCRPISPCGIIVYNCACVAISGLWKTATV